MWFTSGGGATLGQKQISGTAVGQTVYYCNGSVVVPLEVWVNHVKLAAYSYNYKVKTATHELGHDIALGHSNAYAVMTNYANPTSPSSDDECAVNSRYPSTAWPLGWWC